MEARRFHGALEGIPTLNLIMLRYAHAFFNQVAQSEKARPDKAAAALAAVLLTLAQGPSRAAI